MLNFLIADFNLWRTENEIETEGHVIPGDQSLIQEQKVVFLFYTSVSALALTWYFCTRVSDFFLKIKPKFCSVLYDGFRRVSLQCYWLTVLHTVDTVHELIIAGPVLCLAGQISHITD